RHRDGREGDPGIGDGSYRFAVADVVPDEEPVPAAVLGPSGEVRDEARLRQLVEGGQEDASARAQRGLRAPVRPQTGQASPSGSGWPPQAGQSWTCSSTPSSSLTRHTRSRSSSTSTQTPAEAGKTTWSPGCTGICTPTWL